ncbi:acyloxyacyl hydrolase [Thalassotalea euphylliae]|uniref:Lipid A deacylase n=1 Tax=Thalassotalea euphylliae TaxID=1655234 RepID=A0A3E0U3V8_9GAMM|nr:acyloxyacyl hydrolase [Thalassotalea euphylliae]REL31394.1 acyloxyacyl hydrolase [Thalassotalea euphylliae]
MNILNSKLLITVLFFTLILSSFTSYSSERKLSQAIAVDVLIGSDDIDGLRLAYRPHVYHLEDILFVDQLDIYWEVSVNFWEYGESNQHETNYVLAFSPVIGQTFYHIKGKYPLRWEFGIGISLVEDTRFAGKDIGSHYQFEDRLGLAIDFGQNNSQSAAIRYMHYSNGGLNSKNPGVDFLNLSYAYSF